MNEKAVTGRQCDECHACCIRLRIKELNKDERVPCPNLVQIGESKNCGIYERRPKACQDFECLWRSGWAGGESHRPDKLGIMFTVVRHNNEDVIHMWELEEGVLAKEKVKRIVIDLGSKISFVFVALEGKCALVGSEGRNLDFLRRHKNSEITERLSR